MDDAPSGYSVLVHQLTSPRTVQATIALMFSVLTVVEVYRGNEPHDLLMIVLAALVGFYFGDVSNPLSGLINGNSARIVDAYASRIERATRDEVKRALETPHDDTAS